MPQIQTLHPSPPTHTHGIVARYERGRPTGGGAGSLYLIAVVQTIGVGIRDDLGLWQAIITLPQSDALHALHDPVGAGGQALLGSARITQVMYPNLPAPHQNEPQEDEGILTVNSAEWMSRDQVRISLTLGDQEIQIVVDRDALRRALPPLPV